MGVKNKEWLRRNLNGLFLKIILINDIVCIFDKNYDCGKVKKKVIFVEVCDVKFYLSVCVLLMFWCYEWNGFEIYIEGKMIMILIL